VKGLRLRALAGALASFASFACAMTVASVARAQVANNQTDGRDYEALAYLPKDTLVALGYFREASTSDTQSYSQSQGIFRASYILKFGNLAVVPFDALVPVVDATVYAPVPMMPGLTATLHTSGVGDVTYLPTIGYIIPENDTTHTVVAATAYVTAPTGSYDSSRLVNIGDNRWRVQPQIAVSQRFLKALTLDLIGSLAFYTNNTEFPTGTATVTMKQDPTFGFEAHVFGDLSPTFSLGASYYLAAVGQRSIEAPGLPLTTIDPKQTTQTLRFTFGIRVEKNTGVYLQYNQDIEASDGASIGRFIGARITHAVFL
jgi:hypothetical protein